MNQNNPRILTDIITNISETRSKEDVLNELNKVDQKMFQIYGRNYDPKNYTIQINKPSKDTVSLGIPKAHSLTDSLMKTTFGCEEKLAKSYLQILDQSTMVEEEEKQKRIDEAKSRFATANNFKDFCANSKPYMNTSRFTTKRIVPVIDNEHDSYLKTQLMFLEKPKGGSKVNQKEYFDKHIDSVTKKINEIGGMEDTIRNMEESLSKNEIKNFKKRSMFTANKDNNPYILSKPQRKDSTMSGNSWMDRSKTIRQTFMDKFNIQ